MVAEFKEGEEIQGDGKEHDEELIDEFERNRDIRWSRGKQVLARHGREVEGERCRRLLREVEGVFCLRGRRDGRGMGVLERGEIEMEIGKTYKAESPESSAESSSTGVEEELGVQKELYDLPDEDGIDLTEEKGRLEERTENEQEVETMVEAEETKREDDLSRRESSLQGEDNPEDKTEQPEILEEEQREGSEKQVKEEVRGSTVEALYKTRTAAQRHLKCR